MTFIDWLRETQRNVAEDGWDGVEESFYRFRVGIGRRLDAFVDEGTNVYDRDWDLLVILDGCRTDAMKEVAHEYDFLNNPGTHRSPGSASYQWMDRTFTDKYTEEMRKTAHVTANPFSDDFCAPDDWAILDEVWRDGWDDDIGTVPAQRVTDRAIQVAREHEGNYERLLVHYMQPHLPSVPNPLSNAGDLGGWRDGREMAWQGLRRGQFSEKEVWDAYISNLRYVLDEVDVLLSNVNAGRAVLSADHGNAKGEWGIYGHPNVPLNVLRDVPWYRTSAIDERTRDPDLEFGKKGDSSKSVEERLNALGYTE